MSDSSSDDDLRADLASSEDGLGADLVSANAYHTVRDSIKRTKTYSDYGKELPIDGYDMDFYSRVFSDKPTDNDLYLPAKLNISTDLYGTSNNAALLNLLGNNNNSFRSQIVSGNTSVLSGYAMVEDLLIYGGIIGKSSVTTSSPSYTAKTIIINDDADISKLRVDSVIRTSDGYWGKVTSISNKTINVDFWYKSKVAGVPTGTTAELNRIDKTYLSNLVMWIPSTYTGTKVVGAEWDYMIASSAITEKNGLDQVLHSSSVYGMDTALRVRSAADGLGWSSGMRLEDITYAGIYIANGSAGVNASLGSFVDASSNVTGIRFQGQNSKYSILWRYPGTDVYPSALNPNGFKIKGGSVISHAVSGTTLTLDYASYFINNNTSEFLIILPTTNLTAGQEIDFEIFGMKTITVKSNNSSVNVNETVSYSFTPSKNYSLARARWSGSGWYFFS
ncbi:TPA: hypothetical protein I8Y25_004891 [Raoultella ornithinolytica]|nr:hypothetical protein [Raoultella ornithinolytica]